MRFKANGEIDVDGAEEGGESLKDALIEAREMREKSTLKYQTTYQGATAREAFEALYIHKTMIKPAR